MSNFRQTKTFLLFFFVLLYLSFYLWLFCGQGTFNRKYEYHITLYRKNPNKLNGNVSIEMEIKTRKNVRHKENQIAKDRKSKSFESFGFLFRRDNLLMCLYYDFIVKYVDLYILVGACVQINNQNIDIVMSSINTLSDTQNDQRMKATKLKSTRKTIRNSLNAK